jgi:hypothetical protein
MVAGHDQRPASRRWVEDARRAGRAWAARMLDLYQDRNTLRV